MLLLKYALIRKKNIKICKNIYNQILDLDFILHEQDLYLTMLLFIKYTKYIQMLELPKVNYEYYH